MNNLQVLILINSITRQTSIQKKVVVTFLKGFSMRTILLFILILSSFKNSFAIIGGSVINPDMIPQIQGFDDGQCTMSLVGPRVVITAAHCVGAKKTGRFWFKGKPIKIRKLTRHVLFKKNNFVPSYPEYDLALDFDIAIGILDYEIPIAPLTIDVDFTPLDGQKLFFIGEGNVPDRELMIGHSYVKKSSHLSISVENQIDNITSDTGDSGGPFLTLSGSKEIKIIGIISTSTRRDNLVSERYPTGSLFGPIATPFTTGISRTMIKGISIQDSFIYRFAKENNLEICGLNSKCIPVYLDYK